MGYSCETKEQTLQWIQDIVSFLNEYKFIWRSHVNDFFQEKLWEAVDKEWMECLSQESIQNVLSLHSGIIQDYWPKSLKDFLKSVYLLSIPREVKKTFEMHFPGLKMTSLDKVLIEGMNFKKKHEVEALTAVIQRLVNEVAATHIIDVGAGQGYLTQVLSFKYNLPVLALDSCAHHGSVMIKRASKIKKHYKSKTPEGLPGFKRLNLPQVVTCKIIDSESLLKLIEIPRLQLSSDSSEPFLAVQRKNDDLFSDNDTVVDDIEYASLKGQVSKKLVLAGLHACGDLSVTMLRAFLECKEIKAMISIGCCYNLLSEQSDENNVEPYGFPLSNGVSNLDIYLGRNGRDVACKSPERWSNQEPKDAMENFEAHAFRAAFQMILKSFFPMLAEKTPSLRQLGQRRRKKKINLDHNDPEEGSDICPPRFNHEDRDLQLLESKPVSDRKACNASFSVERVEQKTDHQSRPVNPNTCPINIPIDEKEIFTATDQSDTVSTNGTFHCCERFKDYCKSAMKKLTLSDLSDEEICQTWKGVDSNINLIGPYWSLRATFGPLLETLLLLDRLLFLQESGLENVMLVPLFDPLISPRNMAIIAYRN